MTPTPAPEPLRSLPAIALELRTVHNAFIAKQRSALEHAKKVGELLIEAQAQLKHGEWLPWLEAQLPEISPRTAQGYMRLAHKWPQLLAANTRPVAHLGIREALTILTDEWNDPDELGAGGSDDHDDDAEDDDDQDDDEDSTDRYGRTFQMRFTVKELAEFRQQLRDLKPFLRTNTDAETVREAIRLCHAAMCTSDENNTKDDDANDPALRRRLDAER